MTAYRPTRRTLFAAAAALPLTAAIAACADSGDGPSLDGGKDADAYTAVIDAGPVADDAAVSASAWAKKIKDAGVMKRGGTVANNVFSLKNPSSGQVTGFDAGITQLLGRYIFGKDFDAFKQIEYIDTTVETRETLIQNGTVDCVIATYSITKERLEKIAYAGPYYMSGTSIQILTKNKESITSTKDLTGKKLVTQSNSTGIQAIEQNVKDPASVDTLADNETCLAALKQGRYDAYVLDQGVLLGNSAVDKDVTVVGEPFTEDPYGIGLPKDDKDAVDFVNGFLKAIEDDGTWKKLWDATLGKVMEGEAPTPPPIGEMPA